MIWIIGAEGWLGPNALGLTGPPNSLTAMVPIIVISLTVDYAIQTVSHYREQRVAGERVVGAIRAGLRNVTVPVTLAAVTTIVSLLMSLFSPIGIVGDFGIIAALGVGMSLIVMLTLVPAGRAIIDRRREARGTLTPHRPISNALPGVERVAELLGREVTRRPAPYIILVVAVTIALGFGATGLTSAFNIRDILPRGGSVLEDMNTLDAGVDDYVVRPFSPTELVTRVQTALRRRAAPELAEPSEPYRLGELTIDYPERRVSLLGRSVRLTDIEYRLLDELSVNAGRVLTHDHLLQRIWGLGHSGHSGPVRTFVKNLRHKLGDDADHPAYIFTEPRVGYRMAKGET